MSNPRRGSKLLLIVGIVFVVGYLLLHGNSQDSAIEGTLPVNVSRVVEGIKISNEGGVELGDCTVVVNNDYWARDLRIPGAGSTIVWWGEMKTRGTDVRFDPSVERLRRVHVMCSTPKDDNALFGVQD